MAKYSGPYEPVNLNEGIALECERDEFGHFTHTLWVDGEVYQITEHAWEKLMRFNFDRFEEGKQAKQEAIIHLIEKQLCGNPDCSNGYGHNTCQLWLDAIAVIKGEK